MGGLARFDGKAWRTYTVADGLPGNHVLALHHDARNGLWIGTGNGLARMKKDGFQVMTTREGLFANAVFAVASAPREIWVGSYGGVARIRSSN
jgi:ligand-binding sensor domain-containing protein